MGLVQSRQCSANGSRCAKAQLPVVIGVGSMLGVDASLAGRGAGLGVRQCSRSGRRDEALRRELSISPRYFKAHSALIASIQ